MLRAKQIKSKKWKDGTDYIYVNGCSHTTGTRLSLPDHRDGYPFILGELLGLNTISSASQGSSNQRILRSTIDFLCDVEVLPKIVIIQWSGTDRFETPHNLNELFTDDHHEGWKQHIPFASVHKDDKPDLPIFFKKFYRVNFFSKSDQEKAHWDGRDYHIELKRETAMAAQILALDSYIKSLGIETVIHFPFTRLWTYEKNSVLQIALDMVNIPTENKASGLYWPLIDHGHTTYSDKDRHFMIDAHKQIALWLYDYIEYGTTVKTLTNNLRSKNGFKSGIRTGDPSEINHYELGSEI